MRILLLGRNGQVSSSLRQMLPALGELTVLGSADLDLATATAEQIRAAVASSHPQVIVNAAAYTAVDAAEDDPAAWAVNAAAPGVLAQAARAHQATFIHYSTDYVFDGTASRPYVETDPTAPVNAYGASKLAGEARIAEAGGAYLILRTSWVYSLHSENFVTKVLGWARRHPTLRIVTDQVGTPTWAWALAEATTALLRGAGGDPYAFFQPYAGVYHLAGRGATTRLDWARAAIRHDPGRAAHVVTTVAPTTSEAFPTPALRPAYTALDSGRIERTFGVALAPWADDLVRALDAHGAPVRNAPS